MSRRSGTCASTDITDESLLAKWAGFSTRSETAQHAKQDRRVAAEPRWRSQTYFQAVAKIGGGAESRMAQEAGLRAYQSSRRIESLGSPVPGANISYQLV